jgi:hypothetical protein
VLFEKDLQTIKCRLDTVEELIQNEDVLHGLRKILGEFTDVEYLFSLFVQIHKQEQPKAIEGKTLNILRLKHVLNLIGTFKDLLKNCKTAILATFLQVLWVFIEIWLALGE